MYKRGIKEEIKVCSKSTQSKKSQVFRQLSHNKAIDTKELNNGFWFLCSLQVDSYQDHGRVWSWMD